MDAVLKGEKKKKKNRKREEEAKSWIRNLFFDELENARYLHEIARAIIIIVSVLKLKCACVKREHFFFFFCITKILKFPIGQIYLYRSKKLLAINENACKNLRILACPSIISLVSPAWNILCVWNINDLQRVGTFNER